jgi:uncharacterized caspase-like protein
MLRSLCPLCLSLTFAASPAAAEVRALLVGVSDYLVLDADLKGPAADVRLMAETLQARGVDPAQITALTSDLAGLNPAIATGAPLRGPIIAAMTALTEAARPGDTVVFYFSGHGAQAPDLSGDEGGGNDEILLPADAAGWKGQIGAVENALVDDELQDWAQGLLSKGVRLVGLIDACHSDTGFRAVGGQGVARGLSEEALSIPQDVVSVQGGAGTPPLTGEFVFLYSSQSDQRSFEYPLADGSEWHGEFTLRLAQVLREAPQASWAQVLRATSDAMVQGAARQLPDGEGTLMQAPVFGEGAVTQRLALAGGALQGGLLEGLNPGDTVAFYAAPAGGRPLGEAQLTRVEARRAALSAPVPDGALWAEVTVPAAPAPLALAAPVRADPADGHDYSGWTAVLPAPSGPPDLVPVLVDGTVALAGADGALDPAGPGSTPRIRPEPGESPAAALARALERAGRSLHLRKMIAALSGRSLTGQPPLSVGYELRPGTPDGGDCGSPGAAVAGLPEAGLQPCDQLWITFTNTSGKALDVSALYFNADFTVTPLWPREGLSNRLAPGESARAGLMIAPGSPPAIEELLLAAVPVDPEGTRVDLTRLVAEDTTRAAGGDSAPESWLAARLAGEDETTRGFSARPAAVMMVRQPVRLAPAPDAAD